MNDDGNPRANEETECSCTMLWDCGSPLYDSFEVVAIHYIIDKHLVKLPYDLPYHVMTSSSATSASSSTRSEMRSKLRKLRKGFSFIVCSIVHTVETKIRMKKKTNK